jgi:hypothetical protein
MDVRTEIRLAARMYKGATTDRQRRRAYMLWLDRLMAFAELELEWDDLEPGRKAIYATNAHDEGSKDPLLGATGKRISLGDHGRRAWLAAGMEWLRRSGLDNGSAARKAIRLAKIRDVTSKDLIEWREVLMARASETDSNAVRLARERFLTLTDADYWIGPGFDNPTAIAKRILQAKVTEIPK